MALIGRQYTVTASAVAPLAVAAGRPNPDQDSSTQPGHIAVQEVHFSTPAGNSGVVYLGNSNVAATPANALAIIGKGVDYVLRLSHPQVLYADDIFVVGTANDVIHIFVIPY